MYYKRCPVKGGFPVNQVKSEKGVLQWKLKGLFEYEYEYVFIFLKQEFTFGFHKK